MMAAKKNAALAGGGGAANERDNLVREMQQLLLLPEVLERGRNRDIGAAGAVVIVDVDGVPRCNTCVSPLPCVVVGFTFYS